MNKIGYINLSGVHIAQALINEIPCDYMYNTYYQQYESLCRDNNLTPTNCILYGHDSRGQKFSLSEFYKI